MEFNQRAEKSVIFLPLIQGSGEISRHLAMFSLDWSLLKEQLFSSRSDVNIIKFRNGCFDSLATSLFSWWLLQFGGLPHFSIIALLLRGADCPPDSNPKLIFKISPSGHGHWLKDGHVTTLVHWVSRGNSTLWATGKDAFQVLLEATQRDLLSLNRLRPGIAVPILTPRRKPARGKCQRTEVAEPGETQGKRLEPWSNQAWSSYFC